MNIRQQTLLMILKQKKALSLEELSKLLSYSTSTIRRDLNLLESIGLAKLDKGIIKLIASNSKEKHFKLRTLENIPQKEKIAKLCDDFFSDGMSLFMDSSSTTLYVCPLLAHYKNVTVITNGIEVAHTLMQMPNVEVFVVGGYIKEGTSSLVGEPAIDYIKQFNLDLALISCYGIDERGIYDVSLQQSHVKRCMLDHATTRLLLCDSSKFGHIYKFSLCDFKAIDYLLTDVSPPSSIHEVLMLANCESIYPIE